MPTMHASGHETLRGSVAKVVFHNEESGYCILRTLPEGKKREVTVVGHAPRVVAGERFAAEGSWVEDREHGRQFRAQSLRLSPPDSEDGMVRYLGSGMIDGVGPRYAKRLIDKFGARVFDIIENESAKLEQVEGIGERRRREIRESWLKQKSVHAIMIFLHQHGIGTARALRIHKTYGEEALDILRRNPYRLAQDIRGIGFKTADEIARKMGIAPDAVERVQAGILHSMEEAARNGHTRLPLKELLDQAAAALDCEGEWVAQQVNHLLASRTLVEQHSEVCLPHLLAAEQRIASRVKSLMAEPVSYALMDVELLIQQAETQTGKRLAPSQRECVKQALQNRMMIITGGPGVGKTTILNTLLMVLSGQGVQVVLAAPTGRAAKRMSESTGREAKTLHRLLEYQGEGEWGRNEQRPLVGGLFVLDECSMVDVPLMAQFMTALPDGAHVLLVGDADQLPSVGPGMVLGDLIQSGVVPCYRLTEIFRQAADSRIVRSAHDINLGRLPDLKAQRESDFFFLTAKEPGAASALIVDLVRERLPRSYGFEPTTEVQVLCPMNRGPLGTHALNQALQAALNPAGEFKLEIERFGITFRVGDKVIQTRNNYEKEVFNGDMGLIQGISTGPIKVSVRYEGGRTVDYEPGEMDELALAYALTIHKSQGSEFPAVVMPVSTQHFVMLERSLFYTGITRARKLVVLVGDPKAFEIAVRKQTTRRRCTGLRHLL
jgi:exodeoxyribonuclease V alpha subunit